MLLFVTYDSSHEGNLALCRFHSKHLALRKFLCTVMTVWLLISRDCVEIKAHETGLYGERYTSGLKPKSELAGDVQWGKV